MTVDDIREGIANKASAGDGGVNQVKLIEGTMIITRVVSVILGFLSVFILIVIPLIIAGEICYICFPVIREKVDELIIKVEGKGVARRAVEITFRDAIEAVRVANTTEIGEHSAMWVYLRLKVKSLMFTMFIWALVIQGINVIINVVWGGIDGIAKLLSTVIGAN